MKIEIEKISNGYILSLNGLRTFCDVPEAICGLTSEWVLDECRKLDQPRAAADSHYNDAMARALQAMAAEGPSKLELLTDRVVRMKSEPEPEKHHWVDAFRYIVDGVKGLKLPLT